MFHKFITFLLVIAVASEYIRTTPGERTAEQEEAYATQVWQCYNDGIFTQEIAHQALKVWGRDCEDIYRNIYINYEGTHRWDIFLVKGPLITF